MPLPAPGTSSTGPTHLESRLRRKKVPCYTSCCCVYMRTCGNEPGILCFMPRTFPVFYYCPPLSLLETRYAVLQTTWEKQPSYRIRLYAGTTTGGRGTFKCVLHFKLNQVPLRRFSVPRNLVFPSPRHITRRQLISEIMCRIIKQLRATTGAQLVCI